MMLTPPQSIGCCVCRSFVFGLWAAVALVGLTWGAERTDPFLQSSFYGPTAGEAEPRVATADFIGQPPIGGAPRDPAMATDLQAPLADVDVTLAGYGAVGLDAYNCSPGGVFWQILPDGLIYRSYLAGPREARIGTQMIHTKNVVGRSQFLWDGTVGGRRGLVRYGTADPLNPQGWQVDLEGAAIVRLNIDETRDVDASDFRFGVPITYGNGPVQYKLGYYHLSSHLGDEFIVRTGSTDRVNYVRDSLLLGISYNPTPAWRVYAETAYAVFVAGGAEPWEFQFGVEYAQPGPTGFCGTPFFATNAHLREEVDFGGDWTTQFGWLWRGGSGSTMRVGFHYMNGKSTNYQWFDTHEEQIGVGMWYDF